MSECREVDTDCMCALWCSAAAVQSVGRGAHVYQRALASMTNPLLITQGLYHYTGWYVCDVIYLLFP